MKQVALLIVVNMLMSINGLSQVRPAEYQQEETWLWLGSFNTFRLSEKLFWRAEFHYRRIDFEETPFIGRMAQVYNRHALNYVFNPNFNVSFGGVLRLDFTPEPNNRELDPLIGEPRIWHEYMFIMPNPRYQIYHRIRIEHRWNRTHNPSSDWIYRNRYRYNYFMKIPITKRNLVPGAFYVNPSVEVILQSGKAVGGSPLEDLRLYNSIGYIVNPRVTYSAGLMYTTGQTMFDVFTYRQRWVIRLNAYISLDFRKEESKIPSVKLSD